MPFPVVASYTTGGLATSADVSFVLGVPAGVAAGDLLLMFVCPRPGYPIAGPPSGFTLIPGSDTGSGGGAEITVYSKVATGSETAWTLAASSGYSYLAATCARITGAQASFVVVTAVGPGGYLPITNPNVTTAAANSLVFWAGGVQGGSPLKPTAATAVFDLAVTSAHCGLSVSYTQQATAGTVTGLVEPAYGTAWAVLSLAVAPTGVTAFTGAGTVTLGPTVTATGQAAYAGSGSVALGPTVSASGGAAYAGLAVANLGPTVSATGAVVGSFSGSGAVTLGPTVAATGQAAYAGSGAVALGPTVSASGGAAYVGLAVAMLGPTVAATGAVVGSFSGSGSVVLGPTVSATGLAAYAGSGTVALGPTVAATGSTAGVFSGSGAVVLGPTVAATGTAAYVGSGSVNIGPTVRATGSAGSTAAASAGPLVLFGLGGGSPVMMGLGGGSGLAPPPVVPYLPIRRAVVATLKADPRLAALVGSKIFPGVIPETSPMPAVVYQFEKITREYNLGGPNGVAVAAVTIYGVSKVATECVSIGEAVRQLFDGFRGFLVTAAGRVRVLETTSADEDDVFDPPADATGRGVYETSVSYRFRYRETLPARMS